VEARLAALKSIDYQDGSVRRPLDHHRCTVPGKAELFSRPKALIPECRCRRTGHSIGRSKADGRTLWRYWRTSMPWRFFMTQLAI
jgi:hypothetical protein